MFSTVEFFSFFFLVSVLLLICLVYLVTFFCFFFGVEAIVIFIIFVIVITVFFGSASLYTFFFSMDVMSGLCMHKLLWLLKLAVLEKYEVILYKGFFTLFTVEIISNTWFKGLLQKMLFMQRVQFMLCVNFFFLILLAQYVSNEHMFLRIGESNHQNYIDSLLEFKKISLKKKIVKW